MTQEDRVLQLLRRNGTVDTVQMIHDPVRNTIRLGAIIHKLRSKGYIIETRDIPGGNYAQYRLIAEPKKEKVEPLTSTQSTLV